MRGSLGRFGRAGPVKHIPVDQASADSLPGKPLTADELLYQAYLLKERRLGREPRTPSEWREWLSSMIPVVTKSDLKRQPTPARGKKPRGATQKPIPRFKPTPRPLSEKEARYQARLTKAKFGQFPVLKPED